MCYCKIFVALIGFGSLDIEICNLSVIWCLRFGILLSYKTFYCNYIRIYFDVTLLRLKRALWCDQFQLC